MVNAIVTMAGFGRRFSEAGYTVPKYRVVAHGRSLFEWSMLSLRSFTENGASFVFIVRAADGAERFIRDEAVALGMGAVSIVSLEEPTNGQATTALAAEHVLREPAAPMLIYNIDTFVHPRALLAAAVRGDGWIPCFAAAGEAWSFAAVDERSRVTEVREKKRISPHATVGLYYFSSFELYADLYARHYKGQEALEKGEAYVAPMYNTLIELGGAVYMHTVPLDAVIPLGVPEDVRRFLASTPPAV